MSAKLPLIRFEPIIKINDDEEGEETHIMNWMAVPRARTDAAEATGATGQDPTAQDSPDSDDPTLWGVQSFDGTMVGSGFHEEAVFGKLAPSREAA